MSPITPINRCLVISGVGFRGSIGPNSGHNVFESREFKPNIGAAVALAAARAGYPIAPLSRTLSKLEQVCNSIKEIVPTVQAWPQAIDLLDEATIKQFASDFRNDHEIDFVHCAGLSAGSYSLPNDNPYLPVEDTPIDLPAVEFEAVIKTLLVAVRAFLPRWKRQKRTRLVIVSSMSGIRAFPFGFSHCSAKGALTQAVRSLTLELNPYGIRVSDVQPGMVDTGLYDPRSVDSAVRTIGHTFGYDYAEHALPQMQPSAVAEAVMLCLTSESHILNVSMVAEGQFPNISA